MVGNAIRHTPSGGTVTLRTAHDANRDVLEVADTGEGIAPELLPHVFERFVRGPGSKGSGLGLAIAHAVVVAHGGHIDVKSVLGHGTTFRITLPTAK